MTPAATPDLGDRPIRVGPAYRRRAGASNKGRPLTNRWARVQLLVPRCPLNVWPRQTLTPRAPRPAGSTTHHHSTPLTPGERGAALPSVAVTKAVIRLRGLGEHLLGTLNRFLGDVLNVAVRLFDVDHCDQGVL